MPRRPEHVDDPRNAIPRWISGVVVVVVLLSALGAGIAVVDPTMLTSSHDPMNRAADVYAGYLVSRNLAMAFVLAGLWATRERRALALMMGFTALVQFLDAIVDTVSGRLSLVPGLALLTCICVLAASALAKTSTRSSTPNHRAS